MSSGKFHISDMRFKIMTAVFAVMLASAVLSLMVKAAVTISKAEYEGEGRIAVAFSTEVSYENVKIAVTDSAGNAVDAVIAEMDDDELEFVLSNYVVGETYLYTIEGVREKSEAASAAASGAANETASSPVSGKFRIPESYGVVPVKKVEYDEDCGQVEIEFDARVEWETPSAVITSGAYNKVTGIDDYADGEIEISVEQLQKGVMYRYTITGVRIRNSNEPFGSVSGTFSY